MCDSGRVEKSAAPIDVGCSSSSTSRHVNTLALLILNVNDHSGPDSLSVRKKRGRGSLGSVDWGRGEEEVVVVVDKKTKIL